MRLSDPEKYGRNKLAKMFGVTSSFIAGVAALKKPMRTALVRARDREHMKAREKWSERHEIVRAIRAKRREYW